MKIELMGGPQCGKRLVLPLATPPPSIVEKLDQVLDGKTATVLFSYVQSIYPDRDGHRVYRFKGYHNEGSIRA